MFFSKLQLYIQQKIEVNHRKQSEHTCVFCCCGVTVCVCVGQAGTGYDMHEKSVVYALWWFTVYCISNYFHRKKSNYRGVYPSVQ